LLVVIIIAAIIIAELFINSTFQLFAAGETGFGFRKATHSKGLSQGRYKNISVCKRFYTFGFGSKRLKTDSGFFATTSLFGQSDGAVRLAEIIKFKKSFRSIGAQNLKLCTH
jgi:hypothetical protein